MRQSQFYFAALMVVLLAACEPPPDLGQLEAKVITRAPRVNPTLAETEFGQAVRSAVKNSPTLGRGTAALMEAEAGLLSEGGAFRTQASIGAEPQGEDEFSSIGFGSMTQLLYDGGVGRARETAAEARVLGGIAGRMEAGSQAALAATEAWAEVATSRALLRAADASLLSLEATMVQIAERAAAGAGASGEVLTARSRLANERAAAVNAEAEVARAEAVFVEVFGYLPGGNLGLPPVPPRPPSNGAFGSSSLLQLDASLLAAQADHVAAVAGRVPSVSLTVSMLAGASAAAGISTKQLVTPAYGRKADVAAAAARIKARRADLDATRRELESRLRTLTAEVQAVGLRVDAAREATDANRGNLVVARDQYNAGRQTLIALLDAEREALASERLRILAEHDQAILGYVVLTTTGDILDAFGIQLPDASAGGPPE